MPCRFPGLHLGGMLRGIWSGGSPGPHPGGLLAPGGVCFQGQGLLRGEWRPPRDGYYCGWYASYWNAFLLVMSALKRYSLCIAAGLGGGCIPACLAGFQAYTWGGSLGGSGQGVSRPTPKGDVEGDLAGGVSRPTPKGEVEGDLVWGFSRPTPGGVACSWGSLLPGSGSAEGGVETPPGRLLLRVVRILLECILVSNICSKAVLVVIVLGGSQSYLIDLKWVSTKNFGNFNHAICKM